MPFISCQEGNLTDVFVTETEIVDRFVGNQLWTWGYNNAGQLGNNNSNSQSSPVQTVSTGTNWKQVDSGTQHSAAVKTDGTLWLWGCNASGQLGNNNATNQSSPVQTVSSGTNWKHVSAGSADLTASIKTDGTLWLWGCNQSGNLGNNRAGINHSSPIQTVSTGTNWKYVELAKDGVNYPTVSLKTDGTLWVWGCNNCGQLGTNSTISQSSPVQTVSTGTDWKSISSGAGGAAAIKIDGTLWLWGRNIRGTLGDNNSIDRSSPVQTISTGTNWKQVSLGSAHTAALKIDGTLWVWGFNGQGQLGNNDIVNRSSPIQTVSTGTNWKQVSAGTCQTGSIKTDGTLWVWGCGGCGQLGNSLSTNRSSPVQTVSTGTNWKQVGMGGRINSAVTFTKF